MDRHPRDNHVAMGGRAVGPGRPCLVIAEAGVNHNGDMALAHRLIDAAVAAGADAVKFQTFEAGRLVAPDAPRAAYQRANTGDDGPQHAMLRALELPRAAHGDLLAHCREAGILFLSSPFDAEAADFLVALGVPALKIPSGEITNLPFLARCAGYGLPLILSTGMADLGEVAAALDTLERAGDPEVVLLHCLSNYPADPAEVNLRAMATLEAAFGLPTGFSDHTLGIAVPTAAAALGAVVVEKHFTLDRTMPGPDHRASLEPDELADMVSAIRTVEAALGDGRKRCRAGERDTRAVARRSLATARAVPAGTVLRAGDLTALRPGTGLPPAFLAGVIGRRTVRDLPAGTLVALEHLEGHPEGPEES